MPCSCSRLLPLRRYLKRPYGRVDRPKLKRRLLERCIESGVMFHRAKVGGGAEANERGGLWLAVGCIQICCCRWVQVSNPAMLAFGPGLAGQK